MIHGSTNFKSLHNLTVNHSMVFISDRISFCVWLYKEISVSVEMLWKMTEFERTTALLSSTFLKKCSRINQFLTSLSMPAIIALFIGDWEVEAQCAGRVRYRLPLTCSPVRGMTV